jgi:glycosyltransferase involved in cell wall biosynthesis
VKAAARNHPILTRRGVTVIPNGIDIGELGAESTASWSEVQPPYVLSVATLVAYKGVDILIRAFAHVADAHPSLRLKLVSGGPERDRLVALAAQLSIGDRVDFLGSVGRAAVADLIRGSTVFVLASRSDSESFGIAAAEALALDRAVVASSVGGLPELVESGTSGVLVPPGDSEALANAMRQLLDDRQLRERLGRAGGTRIRRDFLWRCTGEAYEALFLRVSSAVPSADSSTSMPANTAT